MGICSSDRREGSDNQKTLRFNVGDRVEVLDPEARWRMATVVARNVSHPVWTKGQQMPYQVKIDDLQPKEGGLIFVEEVAWVPNPLRLSLTSPPLPSRVCLPRHVGPG